MIAIARLLLRMFLAVVVFGLAFPALVVLSFVAMCSDRRFVH